MQVIGQTVPQRMRQIRRVRITTQQGSIGLSRWSLGLQATRTPIGLQCNDTCTVLPREPLTLITIKLKRCSSSWSLHIAISQQYYVWDPLAPWQHCCHHWRCWESWANALHRLQAGSVLNTISFSSWWLQTHLLVQAHHPRTSMACWIINNQTRNTRRLTTQDSLWTVNLQLSSPHAKAQTTFLPH